MATRVLAIQTVGTQDIQTRELDGTITTRLGMEPKVKGRQIAELLGTLDDEELAGLLAGEALRNAPCYGELDRRYPEGWTLGLLATDQPDTVEAGFRDSDTIGLAHLQRRWFEMRRPGVHVLEPLRVTSPPHQADDRLVAEIASAVGELLNAADPDIVVVLPVGATPTMRFLTERAVEEQYRGPVVSLVPDPSSATGISERTLYSVVRADRVAAEVRTLVAAAIRGARYRAAREALGHFEDLFVAGRALDAWLEIGRNLVEDRDVWASNRLTKAVGEEAKSLRQRRERRPWRARLEARIGLVRRASDEGRIEDALTGWVSASELLPVVLLEHLGCPDADLRPFGRAGCDYAGFARNLLDQAEPTAADEARAAVECATRRPCRQCPYQQLATPSLLTLRDDADRARLAQALRRDRTRTAPIVVDLRNDLVHVGRPSSDALERRLHDAVRHELDVLQMRGVPVDADPAEVEIADLLAIALEALTGEPAFDHLGVVEEHALDALVASGAAPGGLSVKKG